ncbi:rhodanese-like domain-containing protein [Myroides marinus]|uniref:Rhodanese n=1 Tax=Myroides marinus TaxID=703342 RepID=A0A161UD09_9FLAO|nr:rhodanese-like domain-containing protein [Myroides marinus]KZE84868.1 rhodanese [Myroides marinus]MDM1348799.1 rhodanese-like domain-containing protein [Myroides marinus]MDM1352552.1 rhodanese-like domain-containing protein [Myroides marinus]MDM1354964.1 rhodanese-like domain-containing protein [Myroides marinus]MDM1359754.1 rhodanese-like domain-containing protein [Myroides marinus]
MTNLSQEQWWEKAQADANAIILDVRTEEEVEEKAIPGSLNIDIYKGQGFLDEIAGLDKSKAYYIYCKSGGRSSQACHVMESLGFEETHNLLGGITEWEGPIK